MKYEKCGEFSYRVDLEMMIDGRNVVIYTSKSGLKDIIENEEALKKRILSYPRNPKHKVYLIA